MAILIASHLTKDADEKLRLMRDEGMGSNDDIVNCAISLLFNAHELVQGLGAAENPITRLSIGDGQTAP